MRSPRIRARRLVALAASLALALTMVGSATAASPQVTCVRAAPQITFSPSYLVMPRSGAPAFVQVSIKDVDSSGCTAFQTFEWQWQPKKVAGATGITATLVGPSGAAILPGQTTTTLIRVYGFSAPGTTARFSFTATRMDRPALTPATAYFGVVIAGIEPR